MDKQIKQVEKTTKKTKKKRKPNYILITGLIVMLIPIITLGVILVASLEKQGVPVIENRFEGDLAPEITEEMLLSLQSISVEGAQAIEVTLITGTVRISVDVSDDATYEQIRAINDEVIGQVSAITPLSTYFTNHDGIKMYDLEVHTYNVIPKEGVEIAQIYTIFTKTGGAEEPTWNVVSSPKSPEVADSLLNPVKPEAIE